MTNILVVSHNLQQSKSKILETRVKYGRQSCYPGFFSICDVISHWRFALGTSIENYLKFH